MLKKTKILAMFAGACFALSANAAENQIKQKEICAIIGLPINQTAKDIIATAQKNENIYYFQSPNPQTVRAVREEAEKVGLLGTRLFVDRGSFEKIHLADNLIGNIIVSKKASLLKEKEILRVLHPEGKANIAGKSLTKKFPKGVDFWSHPYHSSDNNPFSKDIIAKAPYATQFIAEPKFAPLPAIAVASGKYIFRVFGNMSTKKKHLPYVNKLLCINAYNGMILWSKQLNDGFMIDRNTLIATPNKLYLGDDKSCKIIDNITGKVIKEIKPPIGKVWKWMALEKGVLYALLGGDEVKSDVWKKNKEGISGWSWKIWKGYGYDKGNKNFAFGEHLLAINPNTSEIIWKKKFTELLDARGICMKNENIYICEAEKSVTCLNAKNGEIVWKNSDKKTMDAIEPTQKAQTAVTGFSPTAYIQCNDKYIIIAGPQRKTVTCLSVENGNMLWSIGNMKKIKYHGKKTYGSYGVLLADDIVYAVNEKRVGKSVIIDCATGKITQAKNMPPKKSCARLTGNNDSLFYRVKEGTSRIDRNSNKAEYISPMRPGCNDGVITTGGLLHWGPMICGCELSLFGQIAVSTRNEITRTKTLEIVNKKLKLNDFPIKENDWKSYKKDATRSSFVREIPLTIKEKWSKKISSSKMLTAPIIVNKTIFVGNRNGAVYAINSSDGSIKWKAYTAAAITYPPEYYDNKIFVASADGKIYCYEAATGDLLWRFHIAPQERYIPVFGEFMSTWALLCGIVIEDGILYTVGGIANYDKIYVYAIDAKTGKEIWSKDAGVVSKKTGSGINPTGNLYIEGDTLCFNGGNVYEVAIFNKKNGNILNKPVKGFGAKYRGVSYSLYPEYAFGESIDYTFSDGTSLFYFINYDGVGEVPLSLLKNKLKKKLKYGRGKPRVKIKNVIWQNKSINKITAYIISEKTIVVAGLDKTSKKDILVAYDIKNGNEIWKQKLQSSIVRGGLAIDSNKNIVAILSNGTILLFN